MAAAGARRRRARRVGPHRHVWQAQRLVLPLGLLERGHAGRDRLGAGRYRPRGRDDLL